MIWSLSGTVAYTNGSWQGFSIVKDNEQILITGPNVHNHPTVVELLTSVGLPTATAVPDPTVADLTCRLSINDEHYTLGGTEDTGCTSNNQSALVAELAADSDYLNYFTPYDNDGPTIAQAVNAEFGTYNGPYNFEANVPLWAKFTPPYDGNYIYIRLYSGASPPPEDPATDITTTFYNADGTLIEMDVDNDPGPTYLTSWGDGTQFTGGTDYYARIVVNKRSSLNLRVDYD